MDYAAWKLFADAAELGSLSKVALAYGTTQPHISRQLGALERECGGRLFQRTGRGVVLTELGQRVAPRVRAWLASTDQLANDVRTSAGTPIGKVRIGSLPSTAHPLVNTLYKRLKDGSVDLALLYRTSPTPKNGDTYLVETATYLVGAAGDPLTARPTVSFSALDNLPLVLFCRPNSWRNHLEALGAEHGVSFNVVLEADSLSLQTRVAAEGAVYALLGPYAAAAAAKECRVNASKLVRPVVHRHIALAMSRQGEMTLACRTVMQVTREIAKSGTAGLDRM
jgi:DNA-binding transcriptional LysR family regulator